MTMQGTATRAPTISVVMPCYNSREYLARAIESGLAQPETREQLELVVVDDGSSDDSAQIAESYAARDSRILALRQPNAGPAAARNRGIAAAGGELIAFLDVDDTWESSKLARQAALYRADPELGLIHCGCRFVDPCGAVVEGWVRRPRALSGDALVDFFCDFCLITSAVMVPRHCLDAVGHFDPSLRVGEDNELFLRLLARYRVGCVDEPLLNRTIRPDSLSRLDYDLDARNDLLILDRFLQAHPEFAEQHRERVAARFATYLYDYGYRLLEHGDVQRARSVLADSLKRKVSLGATKALVRSLLPRSTWPLLRGT
jgi:glycosyltransferase involved in cell wall biosynthesis